MTDFENVGEDVEVDIAAALGANATNSVQRLTLYVPNKDREGNEIGTQRKWVLEAASILAELGGGFTILPPVEGGWVDPEGTTIWEEPVLVYTYIIPERFLAALPRLREFLHRLGRETMQGEVAFEFDGLFYRIIEFDAEEL